MCDKNLGDNEIEKEKKIPVIMISEAASTQYRENLLKDIEVAFEGNNDVSHKGPRLSQSNYCRVCAGKKQTGLVSQLL